jgi:hypothetical protein
MRVCIALRFDGRATGVTNPLRRFVEHYALDGLANRRDKLLKKVEHYAFDGLANRRDKLLKKVCRALRF